MTYHNDIRFIMGHSHGDCDPEEVRGRWPDFYSVQFDRSNRIYYQVDGGLTVTMKAPVVYLTHPAKTYRFGPCDHGPWEHSCIGVTGPRAKRLFEDGFCLLSPISMLTIHKPRECIELFDQTLASFRSGDPTDHHNGVIGLERLLGFLIDNQRMNAPEPLYAEPLRDLANHIDAAPFEAWDFESCALDLCISLSHFRKLFRETLKRSPHDFLLAARMRRAAHWLETGNKSIKEVCHQCNYDDLAQFSKAFKRQIGLSPRQFRHSLRLR